MDVLHSFATTLKDLHLSPSNDKLLVAVSGGVDSIVLCELAARSGYDFIMAHGNFQLRGEESQRDQQFVQSLEERYGKKVLVKRFDTLAYAEENKLSVQVAARELRYAWFKEILTNGIDWLVTAHHADDNIETVLMNFFKGTGIAGLRGILPKQQKIIRPLLAFNKEALVNFAKSNNLKWVEDSSNASDKYTRNYFRQQIIPLVKNVFPQAESNLIDNIERFRDIELLYKQQIDLQKKKLLEQRGVEWHIPVLKLTKTVATETVLYEIIKEFGFSSSQTKEVMSLLESETGKYVQSLSHRVIRNRKWLIIAPLQTEQSNTILIEEGDTAIDLPFFNLKISVLNASGLDTHVPSTQALLDLDELEYPLLLRRAKTSDYFYPLGMKKKKKLNRFFIDQKLSKTEKENVWVIESAKRIIWVVGHRIDDRFKINPSTKKVLSITTR